MDSNNNVHVSNAKLIDSKVEIPHPDIVVYTGSRTPKSHPSGMETALKLQATIPPNLEHASTFPTPPSTSTEESKCKLFGPEDTEFDYLPTVLDIKKRKADGTWDRNHALSNVLIPPMSPSDQFNHEKSLLRTIRTYLSRFAAQRDELHVKHGQYANLSPEAWSIELEKLERQTGRYHQQEFECERDMGKAWDEFQNDLTADDEVDGGTDGEEEEE